ncbi:hypothetical protein V2J09_011970 [Rumex salicifolius]
MEKHKFFQFTGELTRVLALGVVVLTLTVVLYCFSLSSLSSISSSGSVEIKVEDEEECDLFEGKWVWENRKRHSYYDNVTCPTLPYTKNCFMYGRKDRDFLNWRWKPNGCELSVFDPGAFLELAQGVRIAFVGDSISRNQADSLVCLLSSVELPEVTYDDKKNKFGTWVFRSYNVTITMLWTPFLVMSKERPKTGGFDLQIDKVDPTWAQSVPGSNIVIVSTGAWFARPNYVYSNNTLLGCYYCSSNNLTLEWVYKQSLKTALGFINQCDECGKATTILRTNSPAHFEKGSWNKGGSCPRTTPLASEDEVRRVVGDGAWNMRSYQMEEFEKAKEEAKTMNKKLMLMDVTRAMVYRADAHPGKYFYYHAASGWSDCRHWCLPGAIDTWNEILFAMLKKKKKNNNK